MLRVDVPADEEVAGSANAAESRVSGARAARVKPHGDVIELGALELQDGRGVPRAHRVVREAAEVAIRPGPNGNAVTRDGEDA